ncbi:MAG: hypothetical protein AMXMBFR33_66930 [Candidatus Xenobia bacterium]
MDAGNLGQVRSQEFVRGIRADNGKEIARTLASDSVDTTRAWTGTEAVESLKYDLRRLGHAVQKEVAQRFGTARPISEEQTALAAGAILTTPLSGVIVYGLMSGLKDAPPTQLAAQVVDFIQDAPPAFQELSRSIQGSVTGKVQTGYVPVAMFLAGAELENEQRRLDEPDRLSSSGFLQLQLMKANGRFEPGLAQQMAQQQQLPEPPGWKAQQHEFRGS